MKDQTLTYSEAKGKAPFDWRNALAIPVTEITREQAQRMRYLANGWTTCACGNQCAVIPRVGRRRFQSGMVVTLWKRGTPVDAKLADLGVAFADAITDYDHYLDSPTLAEGYRLKAIQTLEDIEERSAELIRIFTPRRKPASQKTRLRALARVTQISRNERKLSKSRTWRSHHKRLGWKVEQTRQLVKSRS